MEETNLKKEAADIQLRDHNDLLQIMGRPPGWLLHWGVTIVGVVTVLLLLLSWLVKYPDVVPARVILTTENPPVRVVARINGKIQDLLVNDGQEVSSGQTIVVMEHTADLNAVNRLSDFLNKISDQLKPEQFPTPLQNLPLGKLQPVYANFVKQYETYQFDRKALTVEKKSTAIANQVNQIKKLNESLRQQKVTEVEVITLAKVQRDRLKMLYAEGSVSMQAVEEAMAKYLLAQKGLDQLENQLISNQIDIEALNLQIIDFKENKRSVDYDQSLAVKESIDQLKTALREWKQQYLIAAPIDGIVAIPGVLTSQQFVKANQELLTIVPGANAGAIIGKATLPASGAGKVEPGMSVNIRLDGYPYQEFGAIPANLTEVSLVPEGGLFQVTIELPDILKTTYGKTIPFRQEITGTANIITEDRRIISRIFDKVLSLAFN